MLYILTIVYKTSMLDIETIYSDKISYLTFVRFCCILFLSHKLHIYCLPTRKYFGKRCFLSLPYILVGRNANCVTTMRDIAFSVCSFIGAHFFIFTEV